MRDKFILALALGYLIVFLVLSSIGHSPTKISFKRLQYTQIARRDTPCFESYQIKNLPSGEWKFVRSDGPEDIRLNNELFYSLEEVHSIHSCSKESNGISPLEKRQSEKCLGFQFAEGLNKNKSPEKAAEYFDLASRYGDVMWAEKSIWIKALSNYKALSAKVPLPYSIDLDLACSKTSDSKLSRYLTELALLKGDFGATKLCKERTKYLMISENACLEANFLYGSADRSRSAEKVKSLWESVFLMRGNSAALSNLGLLFEIGGGLDVDVEKARDYYQKAANMGNPAGMRNLAQLLENGNSLDGVHQIKALYERAAFLGDFYSLQKLGYPDPDSAKTIMGPYSHTAP